MALLRGRAIALVLLVLAPGFPRLRAAPSAPTEYEVKAAFLCSFAEFVEWPAAPPGPITIGVLGSDPFGALLEETVRSRAIQTKSLEVRRLSRVEDALKCQIVYVSASEKGNLAAILKELAGSSVLTVSDIVGFAERGGMIGFVLEEKRVRFQINVAAAERSGLHISSRLLRLARIVQPASSNG